jgi:polyphosphate:AMP phosphotransferase
VFESAELGQKLDKAEYEKAVPPLRTALLNAQYDVLEGGSFAVAVVLAGVSGSGRSESAHRLNEWMDPRHIRTLAYAEPTEHEREHPLMWRYWQGLPPRGHLGILLNAWYHEPIAACVSGRIDQDDAQRDLQKIRHFEAMLTDERVLLVKIWLHLSRGDQRKRLENLLDDPLTRWRVDEDDRAQLKHYQRACEVAARALRETSTGEAPWNVVDAGDARYRDVAVGRIVLEAVRERLAAADAPGRRASAGPVAVLADNVKLLRSLDLSKRVAKDTYERQLVRYQERLAMLAQRKRFRRRSMVAVFEGSDAAGKGSSIRRITYALDVRQYFVVPISAPSDEERAQPYLWRFWRRIPDAGQIALFDRSWYGRVLVERVEQLCAQSDWMRAYREINDFEEQLLRHGIIVVKFWLQISREEQLRRFKAREKTPFKRFKITPDDWRNRRKWNAYEEAAADMIERTSTEIAPWTVVESEDKYYARIKILRTLVRALQRAL